MLGLSIKISIDDARHKSFTKNKKVIKIMILPPTITNVMLWKSARKSPAHESHDKTKYGWINKDSVPVPVIA